MNVFHARSDLMSLQYLLLLRTDELFMHWGKKKKQIGKTVSRVVGI